MENRPFMNYVFVLLDVGDALGRGNVGDNDFIFSKAVETLFGGEIGDVVRRQCRKPA